MTNKQELIDCLRTNAPSELLTLDQWVCWRREERGDKWTKVPIDANTGKEAKANDSTTWSSFEKAAQTYTGGKFSGGVGFVFSEHDPYTGIDFDKCIGDDGQMEPDALAMLQGLASYSERSQSGTGAHTIVRGKLPTTGTGRRKGNIEMYHYGRFFVMTGDHMDGTPGEIHERQAELTALYERVFGAEKAPVAAGPGTSGNDLDDGALLQTMFASKNGAHIRGLWDGRTNGYGDDHSAADLALCNHLAYWTNGDAARMGRLFRLSGLYRPKWDERHYADGATYGDATITKALSDFTPQVMHRNGTNGAGYEYAYTGTADTLPPNVGDDDVGDNNREAPPAKDDKRFDPIKAKRALSESGYCAWRWNLVTEQIEVAIANDHLDPDPADTTWTVLNDGIEATIRTSMRAKGWKNMEGIRDLWMSLAYKNRYHPIKDYLTRLQWDGGNYIDALSLYIECTDPPVKLDVGAVSWVELVLKHWLVGAVAKVMHDGTLRAQNPMMVFAGPQGIGKSTFIHWLISGVGDGFFTSEAINPDSPEHQRYLAEKWIWESGELGTTTRRQDVEALKAFLTREVVTYRVPYAKHSVHKPALASFVGTVNPELAGGFLVDITGNRRFVTCTIKRIYHDYVSRIDVNQLWAQAVHLYQHGFDWRLPQNMQAARDKVNDSYMVPDALESYVLAHFEVDPENHGKGAIEGKDRDGRPITAEWFTPTYQIVDRLVTFGVKEGTTALAMKLAKTLSGLKVIKDRGTVQTPDGQETRQTGYYGIRPRAEWRPE